jgi:hypothetical protein
MWPIHALHRGFEPRPEVWGFRKLFIESIIKGMSNKFTVLFAVIAGFAGGFLSRYASPSSVHAQAPTVQQEVRAQKFVLVDERGGSRGAFGIETDGTVQIEITDNKGRVWLPHGARQVHIG